MKVLCFFVCLFSFNLYANSVLENLWEQCRKNSVNLKLNKVMEEQAEENLKKLELKYRPSVQNSSTTSFVDSYSEIVQFPVSCANLTNVSVLFPGSTVLNCDLKYGISRSVLNPFEQISVNNLGYNQSPNVCFSIIQGLNPYWRQGCKKNPEEMIGLLNYEMLKTQNELEEKEILKNLTRLFMEYRRFVRFIEVCEMKIKLMESTIDSYDELIKKGKLEYYKKWDLENNLIEYFLELVNYKESLILCKNEIEVFCGKCDFSLFMNELPSWENELFCDDLDLFLLEQEELKVKNNRVFDLQEIAPKVNVSFNLGYVTMDWTERGKFSWDVSLGINVTDFFRLEKDIVSKVYDLEMIALEKRRELLLEEQSYEKSFYEEMIEENEKLVLSSGKNFENKRSFFESIKDLYSRGMCTDLDFWNAEMQEKESLCTWENYKDNLWLYKWLKNQI